MIGIYLIAAHMAGDYLFQSADMAARKLADAGVRARHVFVYALCFTPISATHQRFAWAGSCFIASLMVAHYLTDSKRWRTSNPWPAMPILQDQSLHIVQIAVLTGIFLR